MMKSKKSDGKFSSFKKAVNFIIGYKNDVVVSEDELKNRKATGYLLIIILFLVTMLVLFMKFRLK